MLGAFATVALLSGAPGIPTSGPADLSLVAIVRGANGRFAVTLVSESRSRAVGAGDLAFGCVVRSVAIVSVRLECGGAPRELSLKTAPATSQAAADPAPPAVEAPVQIDIGRADLEAQLSREMSRLMTETTLVPVTSDGRVTGFTLTRIPEGTILDRLGVRAGDILTMVNDTRVDGFTTLVGLWPRLQREGTVRAQVIRDGRPMDISVNIR
jgi:type II secretory pathway component PulC